MKINLKPITLGLSIVVAATTFLTSCNEDTDFNKESDNSVYKISQTEKNLIDLYADDVATFHGEAVNDGIQVNEKTPFDEESLHKYVKNSILTYNFEYLKVTDTSHIPSIEELSEIYQFSTTGESLDFSNYYSLSDEIEIDFNLISSKMESLQSALEEAYQNAEDYDDFMKIYQDKETSILAGELSFADYACLKMYSMVQLNSFLTWGEFYYGSAQTKGLFTWIRDKAEKLVDKIKPFFKADANGAAVGALNGLLYSIESGSIATVGGAAASIGIGAAVGAVASSLNEYINTPMNYQGK